MNPIFENIAKNRIDKLNELIESGIDLNRKHKCKFIFKEAKFSIEASGREENWLYTPLFVAVHLCRVPIVELLLENGSDPNIICNEIVALQYLAASANAICRELCCLLLKFGAEVNQIEGKDSALMLAIAFRNEDAAVCFIEAGAKLDLAFNGGESALCLAAQKNLPRVVLALLRNGVPVNERSSWSPATPIRRAYSGCAGPRVLALLVGAGARIRGGKPMVLFRCPPVNELVSAKVDIELKSLQHRFAELAMIFGPHIQIAYHCLWIFDFCLAFEVKSRSRKRIKAARFETFHIAIIRQMDEQKKIKLIQRIIDYC